MAESGGLWILDGEDAGSTPWEFDSIVEDGSNVFELDAAAANNGSYGYQATFDGSSRGARGVFAFAEKTEIYVRMYLKFSAGFEMGANYETVALLNLYDAGTEIVCLRGYSHDSAALTRWSKISEITGVDSETSTTNFSLNAWHYAEIYFLQHASAGIVRVYIDGDTVFDDTGLDTSGIAADGLYVGNHDGRGQEPAAAAFVDFDDLKADTSYIGAYSEGGLTFTAKQHMLVGF